MKELIRQKKAPAGAIVPAAIDQDGIYQLDVDDPIWQDMGLEDDVRSDPPLWMCNERVRDGIQAMLELDRCMEEEKRLRIERCSLQEWVMEEWEALKLAREEGE